MIKRLILLWLLMAAPVWAETFYVCHGGNGTLPHTATCSTAWGESNFNNAANWGSGTDKVGAGDIVELMSAGGNLITLLPKAGGASGSPVILQNKSTDNVTIAVSFTNAINFSGSFNCSYFTVRKNPAGGNFSIAYSGTPAASLGAIQINGSSNSNITVDGLTITGNAAAKLSVGGLGNNGANGLWLPGGNYITAQNCTISSMWHGVLYQGGGANHRYLTNNVVHDNGRDGFSSSDTSLATMSQIFLTGNTSYSNGRQGILYTAIMNGVVSGNSCYLNGATGVQLENGAYYTIVSQNLLYNNAQNPAYAHETGTWIDDSQYITVERNICYGNVIGIELGSGSDHVNARNNVTYNNNNIIQGTNRYNSGIRVSTINSGHPWGEGGNYRVYNNTSDHDGYLTSASLKGAYIYSSLGADVSSTIKYANNVIRNSASLNEYYASVTGMSFVGNYWYNPSRTLAFFRGTNLTASQWQALYPTDYAIGTVEVGFANQSSHDYHLTSSSTLLNKGDKLTTVSATGSGTITVADANWFRDTYGIEGVAGDKIAIFTSSWAFRGTATISSLNYTTKVLTVNAVPAGTVSGDYVTLATDMDAVTLTDRLDVGAYQLTTVTSPPAAPGGIRIIVP